MRESIAFNGLLKQSLIAGLNDLDGELSVKSLSVNHGSASANGTSEFIITPESNYNGPVIITYETIDPFGGTSSHTLSFTLNPDNDAPQGADKTISIVEDTSYTFTAADFGFSDVDGDTYFAVKITSLPTSGTLTFNGQSVTASTDVIWWDWLQGLVWTPDHHAVGAGIGSFTFKVSDVSGAFDATARTISFDATPAPTLNTPTLTASGASGSFIENVSVLDLFSNVSADTDEWPDIHQHHDDHRQCGRQRCSGFRPGCDEVERRQHLEYWHRNGPCQCFSRRGDLHGRWHEPQQQPASGFR